MYRCTHVLAHRIAISIIYFANFMHVSHVSPKDGAFYMADACWINH